MNRTIKFRGKRVDTGEWAHGDLLSQHTWQILSEDSYFHVVDSATVQRGTGIETEKGREIFEGDDVYYYFFYDCEGECELEVGGTVVYIDRQESTGKLVGCFALLFDTLHDWQRVTGETDIDYEDMRLIPIPFAQLLGHELSFTLKSERHVTGNIHDNPIP
ncbi:hypothetical protein LEM8419_03527 [Neolewinella maritima]|uniref:YopX protein domain-containing protein n=1 Tax=Neolewinella maritima TaxID=1383882 RepID=A0ABN8FF69_9BACT|nr:hypothetical protein [Neolewinella maritima]CAH1002655.1 hypothetical protein LEM8419_03527 [Neolewinella maritima]